VQLFFSHWQLTPAVLFSWELESSVCKLPNKSPRRLWILRFIYYAWLQSIFWTLLETLLTSWIASLLLLLSHPIWNKLWNDWNKQTHSSNSTRTSPPFFHVHTSFLWIIFLYMVRIRSHELNYIFVYGKN